MKNNVNLLRLVLLHKTQTGKENDKKSKAAFLFMNEKICIIYVVLDEKQCFICHL